VTIAREALSPLPSPISPLSGFISSSPLASHTSLISHASVASLPYPLSPTSPMAPLVSFASLAQWPRPSEGAVREYSVLTPQSLSSSPFPGISRLTQVTRLTRLTHMPLASRLPRLTRLFLLHSPLSPTRAGIARSAYKVSFCCALRAMGGWGALPGRRERPLVMRQWRATHHGRFTLRGRRSRRRPALHGGGAAKCTGAATKAVCSGFRIRVWAWVWVGFLGSCSCRHRRRVADASWMFQGASLVNTTRRPSTASDDPGRAH